MTTYIRYPAGYPQTVYEVYQAGKLWAIRSDVWHTPTSHDGWRYGGLRYTSRAAAEAALRKIQAESAR